jgi:putative hydrolase of the HAD superfamily
MMPRFLLMAKMHNWIFDLDDTLYAEHDYVHSALCFVGKEVEKLYGRSSFAAQALMLNAQGHPDPIAQTWSQYSLPEGERSAMIAAMRAHPPTITLSCGAQSVLAQLRQHGRPYAIVTDGRSVTQRAKIAALECTDAAFVSISEEVGLSKLDPARFATVTAVFPPGQCCYVGDNPAKDFFVPRQLGWKTIMLDHHGKGVHSQRLPDDPAYHPDRIVTDLLELLSQL